MQKILLRSSNSWSSNKGVFTPFVPCSVPQFSEDAVCLFPCLLLCCLRANYLHHTVWNVSLCPRDHHTIGTAGGVGPASWHINSPADGCHLGTHTSTHVHLHTHTRARACLKPWQTGRCISGILMDAEAEKSLLFGAGVHWTGTCLLPAQGGFA